VFRACELGGSHAGVSNRPSLSRASSNLHDPGDGGQQHTVTHVRAMAPQEPGLGIDGLRTHPQSVRSVRGRKAGFGLRAESLCCHQMRFQWKEDTERPRKKR